MTPENRTVALGAASKNSFLGEQLCLTDVGLCAASPCRAGQSGVLTVVRNAPAEPTGSQPGQGATAESQPRARGVSQENGGFPEGREGWRRRGSGTPPPARLRVSGECPCPAENDAVLRRDERRCRGELKGQTSSVSSSTAANLQRAARAGLFPAPRRPHGTGSLPSIQSPTAPVQRRVKVRPQERRVEKARDFCLHPRPAHKVGVPSRRPRLWSIGLGIFLLQVVGVGGTDQHNG